MRCVQYALSVHFTFIGLVTCAVMPFSFLSARYTLPFTEPEVSHSFGFLHSTYTLALLMSRVDDTRDRVSKCILCLCN
uniref:Putative secreted protein n=1 Tax=Anopheles darlingi TaxID=43151 RepID=A0A2M4D417_ANODA